MADIYTSSYPASGFGSESNLRSQFDAIATALNTKVVSKVAGDGSATMSRDLDLNNNDLLNVASIDSGLYTLNGDPLTDQFTAAQVAADSAIASASAASASEIAAAASELAAFSSETSAASSASSASTSASDASAYLSAAEYQSSLAQGAAIEAEASAVASAASAASASEDAISAQAASEYATEKSLECSTSEINASASATQASNYLTSIEQKYLGVRSSTPLSSETSIGTIYFNSVLESLFVAYLYDDVTDVYSWREAIVNTSGLGSLAFLDKGVTYDLTNGIANKFPDASVIKSFIDITYGAPQKTWGGVFLPGSEQDMCYVNGYLLVVSSTSLETYKVDCDGLTNVISYASVGADSTSKVCKLSETTALMSNRDSWKVYTVNSDGTLTNNVAATRSFTSKPLSAIQDICYVDENLIGAYSDFPSSSISYYEFDGTSSWSSLGSGTFTFTPVGGGATKCLLGTIDNQVKLICDTTEGGTRVVTAIDIGSGTVICTGEQSLDPVYNPGFLPGLEGGFGVYIDKYKLLFLAGGIMQIVSTSGLGTSYVGKVGLPGTYSTSYLRPTLLPGNLVLIQDSTGINCLILPTSMGLKKSNVLP